MKMLQWRQISGIVLVSFLFTATTASADYSLKEKLKRQWEKYHDARVELLRVNRQPGELNSRLISRERWEKLLALDSEYKLTAADMHELKKEQAHRIRMAYRKARAHSLIDLDLLRHRPSKKIREFCSQFPKGGMLHVHPGGTIRKETLQRLIRKNDPMLPLESIRTEFSNTQGNAYLYPDELEWFNQLGNERRFSSLTPQEQSGFARFLVLPPGNHPFERFEATFTFIGMAFPEDSFEDDVAVLMEFAQRLAEQKVRYVEFTTGVSPRTIGFWEDIVRRYKSQYDITLRLNFSFYRLYEIEKIAETVQMLLEDLRFSYVLGIDLLGNETHSPALEDGQYIYASVLNAVNDGTHFFHRTMHAGELGDVTNCRDAMIMGAERLGHGVRLQDDPVALEYAALNHIPVEVNLTSNVRLRSIENIALHPYLDYLRLGLPVSLSTDDEGIFETDINQECELAVTQTNVTYAELKQMSFNSLQTAFVDSIEKERLLARLHDEFVKFEQMTFE